MTMLGCRCAKSTPHFFEGAASCKKKPVRLRGGTRAIGREKALPPAHTSDVDMHEVGVAIVAHSSAMQAQGCVTQL